MNSKLKKNELNMNLEFGKVSLICFRGNKLTYMNSYLKNMSLIMSY